ncbi:class I SAM-dependent methyltransferase [Solirubrobacter phytolaccae]|uniref:Class I SAM-dependent methyltransferase n=1 Tax=Solirubrobacter phytolaccae TaxID=1404360 RepID=A0A9X3NE98_9ACTN|nr:class I SAM-dependent methyltransferase [Solirubrobacter phytolaccae]MDA0185110.1 class I SAM-dependent methyltransferase [Solirubrobacter phytolaccae]
MRVPDDWFVGFHEGLAARFWQAAGEAMLDADYAVVSALLPPSGSVLDVPCGNGRLSRRLAEAGYDVTGIDIAPGALALAPPGLRLLQGDLRALPDIGPFDAALSWGNSFGYGTPEDTVRSLEGLRRVVRPGGTLVLESGAIAESMLVRGVTGDSEHTFGAITMRSTRRYDPVESRLEVDTEFTSNGGEARQEARFAGRARPEGSSSRRVQGVERRRAAYFVHTTGEVVRMLRAAGFADVELRGDAGPYELGAPRMIAVAR